MLAQLVNKAMVKKLRFSAFKNEHTHFGGGVYRMFDKDDKIVYIGKSQDLQRRITTHLNGTTNTKYFIKTVRHIDWHRNDSPIMQTMLEGILIAYYKPRYNDEVKDEAKLKKSKK
jgi:excinuclease UvrABC nuclease subunit